MSEHRVTLTWRRDTEGFAYRDYHREHTWDFGAGIIISASAATAYLGRPGHVDPEQAYVASLSSCHMLTFLAIAAMQKITVNNYIDHAVGHLAKNEQGKMAVVEVILSPKIVFAEGVMVTESQLDSMHHKAHEECFIANSVLTKISIMNPSQG